MATAVMNSPGPPGQSVLGKSNLGTSVPGTAPPVSPEGLESIEGLAHDARNVLSALGLYCSLLAEPGVLTPDYLHYASQLNVVVESGVSVIGRMLSMAVPKTGGNGPRKSLRAKSKTLTSLEAEIERRRGMLAVMLGARAALEIECLPCPGSVRLTGEDLGRILVNLVRNAGEAMPPGGRVRISLQAGDGLSFLRSGVSGHPGDGHSSGGKTALLCVQDNGPGIAPEYLKRIFEEGFSTKNVGDAAKENVTAGDDTAWNFATGNITTGNVAKENVKAGDVTAGNFANGNVATGNIATGNLTKENAGNVSAPDAGVPARNSGRTAGSPFGPRPLSRGLGLGIVRGLVEAAGGEIRVVSRPGAGTRFEMEFPLGTPTGARIPGNGRQNHQEGTRVQC